MTVRGPLAAVGAAPTEPLKVLVSGGIGTGKTTALTPVRASLRSAGVTLLSRPPRSDDPAGAAIVIDDAHLLADAELGDLAEFAREDRVTIVVAALPMAHRPALTDLTTVLARETPIVELAPLSGKDLIRATAEVMGAPPPADLGRALMASTAGLPFLLYPAIAAAHAADGGTPASAAVQAARVALVERLVRIDEAVLDTLTLCTLSPELGSDDVAAALRIDGTTAAGLVDHARATGLLSPGHNATFVRGLHRSLAQVVGTARHHEIEMSLLRSQLDMGTLSTDLALRLADHGISDGELARELAGRAARGHDEPGQAARLYRAAADAGATALTAQLADALAVSGDCATASRLADELLGSDDPTDRTAAVRISASIAMHDGSAAQAADLFRWLGPRAAGDTAHVAASAIVHLAVGDGAAARAALDLDASGPPTSTARAAHSLADGLISTIDGPYAVAVTRLSQAITDQRPPGVAPDSAAALVTLVALHGGDPVRARSVIGRAVRTTGGGSDGGAYGAFFVHRHRLLQGWVRMLDGQLTLASADLATTASADLHRRDALWAASLATAIARRGGDTGAMQKHWYAAVEVLSEYSMDLLSLLPLGELWVAAARLNQVDRLKHSLDEAFGLLAALGDPTLWAVPLHWAGVHAGITANDPAAVAPHGQALTAAATRSAFAAALAGAGRAWLRVLANHVDVGDVAAAARGLAGYGLTWDATRLASQAALQTPDQRVSGAMLQVARDLKLNAAGDAEAPGSDSGPSTGAGPSAASGPSGPSGGAVATPFARLSDREREVAELLLQGMQYRDIGSQLLISAKTVEHHVARMRRRLGAESRSEMLSMLRAIVG